MRFGGDGGSAWVTLQKEVGFYTNKIEVIRQEMFVDRDEYLGYAMVHMVHLKNKIIWDFSP